MRAEGGIPGFLALSGVAGNGSVPSARIALTTQQALADGASMASTIATGARAEDLEWLMPALWPTATPRVELGRRAGSRWFVSNPSPHDCRLLVPGGNNRAAAQAVRRYHDGANPRSRLVMFASEMALRLGAARFLTSRIVSVSDGEPPGLIDHLAGVLDTPIGSFGVTLGPRRANRKPVVQLFDEGGRTVGFAKVAVDDYTDHLVAREATWLELATRCPDADIKVPRPLWAGSYAGRNVSVIEPRWALRRPPATTALDAVMVRAVHSLTPPIEARVADSAPALALARGAHPTGIEALRHLGERGALRTSLGVWHGDLTPWNLLTTRSGRVIIDWETAEAGHPLGIDALHHEVASAMMLAGLDGPAALRLGLSRWPVTARALGLDDKAREAVVAVLLLEYVRRDIDLEAVDRPVTGLREPAIKVLARG